MTKKTQPVIKWSGSKRSQASEIISYFPKVIDTYYEPFCGGASVFRALIDSDIKVNKYVISDLNSGLIDLWNKIKNCPNELSDYYEKLWNELNCDDDIMRKKVYYNKVRDRYNREKNPFDFMFLMRTTFNGMPRYNKNGNFNSPFHLTRKGINPKSLREIINEWNNIINNNNVEFISCSYDTIKPNKNDFVYLDPPYAKTKGIYYGTIDLPTLFNFLKNLPCKFAMSFDGISGNVDNLYDIPKEIYDEHYLIKSGNSSFKRIIETDKNAIVYESLYLKK